MIWKRITKKNRPTFPCVVAHREGSLPGGWNYWVAHDESHLDPPCTHWAPWNWPEKRRSK